SESSLSRIVCRCTAVLVSAAFISMNSGCSESAGHASQAPATQAEKASPAPPKATVVATARAEATQPAEPVGNVDDKTLLGAGKNTANWLMYGRTYDANRFSPLDQINKKNVKRLLPVWTFQTGVLDGFECSPLIIGGIMYISTPWNHAYAIDCKTGSQIWHYQKSL